MASNDVWSSTWLLCELQSTILYILSGILHVFWLVATYNLLGNRCINLLGDRCINRDVTVNFFNSLLLKTKRCHVAVCLFSDRSMMMKHKKLAHKALDECVTSFLATFWLHLWQIDSMMPCVSSIIDHRWHQNVPRSGKRTVRWVCHWYSYHILPSSVTYYWSRPTTEVRLSPKGKHRFPSVHRS